MKHDEHPNRAKLREELRLVVDAADDLAAAMGELCETVANPPETRRRWTVRPEGGAFALAHDGETLSVYADEARAVRALGYVEGRRIA